MNGLGSVTKQGLRAHFKHIRQTLPIEQLSHQIASQCLIHDGIRQAQVILSYVGFNFEVSLAPLMQALPNKTWAVPRCLPQFRMAWHPVDPGDVLNPNDSAYFQQSKWGIWEPVSESPVMDPVTADLVLVPALACDRWGQRLGYGAGFYDRFFTQVKVPALGVVPHACWVQDPLPVDPWDHQLEGVVTERGVYPAETKAR